MKNTSEIISDIEFKLIIKIIILYGTKKILTPVHHSPFQ